jgi:ABC-2 type transport system permease protein
MIYWDIVRFSFLRFFSFPLEMFSQIIKRVIELLFLILFWSLVIKSGGINVTLPQIVSYLLIATGVADLAMSRWGQFSSFVGNQIKTGQLSNYLLRPQSLVPNLYAVSLGRSGLKMMLAVVNIIVGLFIFPPHSYISYLLFFAFMINALVISFGYNILESTLFFYFTEANGIRNTVQHVMRIVSGGMIPLYLFPSTFRNIINLTPFPSMVYGPTIALSTSVVNQEVIRSFIVGIFWSVIFNILAYFVWQRSIKHYEAIGI